MIRDERCDGTQHHAGGAIGIDGKSVLALGPHAVVVPAIDTGSVGRVAEVIGQRVVVAAEIMEPAFAERIEHKGACVEIAMVGTHLTAFRADECGTTVCPFAAHGDHFLGLESGSGIAVEGYVRG